MAQTFDGAQYPDALRFTLSSSVNEATQVVIPSTAVKVSIKFASNAGKVAFEGTDGSAINAHYADVKAIYNFYIEQYEKAMTSAPSSSRVRP